MNFLFNSILKSTISLKHKFVRFDRDMYVEVQWNNIQANQLHNFKKFPRTNSYPKYLYDMNSVMMYDLQSFGIGGRPSMVLTVRYSNIDQRI